MPVSEMQYFIMFLLFCAVWQLVNNFKSRPRREAKRIAEPRSISVILCAEIATVK